MSAIKSLGDCKPIVRKRANSQVFRAVRSGVLVRKLCEVCGATEVVAHHEQYERPLEVVWLCHFHHTRRHMGLSLEEMRAWKVAA